MILVISKLHEKQFFICPVTGTADDLLVSQFSIASFLESGEHIAF